MRTRRLAEPCRHFVCCWQVSSTKVTGAKKEHTVVAIKRINELATVWEGNETLVRDESLHPMAALGKKTTACRVYDLRVLQSGAHPLAALIGAIREGRQLSPEEAAMELKINHYLDQKLNHPLLAADRSGAASSLQLGFQRVTVRSIAGGEVTGGPTDAKYDSSTVCHCGNPGHGIFTHTQPDDLPSDGDAMVVATEANAELSQ